MDKRLCDPGQNKAQNDYFARASQSAKFLAYRALGDPKPDRVKPRQGYLAPPDQGHRTIDDEQCGRSVFDFGYGMDVFVCGNDWSELVEAWRSRSHLAPRSQNLSGSAFFQSRGMLLRAFLLCANHILRNPGVSAFLLPQTTAPRVISRQ